MQHHETFMRRCFELARLASKDVKTNPNVGSVLVYNNQIISEGYHVKYGEFHAERMAINNLEDKSLLSESTLYVSLEPCNHFGKTPPCSDLILSSGIKNVVVSVIDPNPKMDGGSIQMLSSKGVNVLVGVLEEEGKRLIAPFKAQLNQRPYVILKWAQSSDAYFGKRDKQVWISNQYSKKLSHKWRTEIDGILIGYNTAVLDNPQLTSRLYPGDNPTRIVIDKHLELERTHHLWADEHKTVFINTLESKNEGHKTCLKLTWNENLYSNILAKLFDLGIYRLMIEGGAKTISHFYNSHLWDEARIIKSNVLLGSGIRAPKIIGRKFKTLKVDSDVIDFIEPIDYD